MICPNCGSTEVWYGETRSLHYARMFVFSRKRYCVLCHSKWKARYRVRSKKVRDWLFVLLFSLLGIVFLYALNSLQLHDLIHGMSQSKGPNARLVQEMQQKLKKDPRLLSRTGMDSRKLNEAAQKYLRQ